MAKKHQVYAQIEALQQRFQNAARGKDALLNLIAESEVAEQVYDSNAIENSTLTFDETEKILLKVDQDRYISERELFEAKNLAHVITYIREKAQTVILDLDLILFLHKILLSNINDDIAGRFRRGSEWVKVGNHIAVDPQLVSEKMEDLIIDYRSHPMDHIAQRIARFHLIFEYIHPFVDGNGRIGRVLNNFILLRNHYVPINIKFIDRDQYYAGFRQFDKEGKTSIMEEIVAKAMTNSYYKRLAYLEGKEIMFLSDYAKREKHSHSNLLNKAKRQTIEAFIEKGKWKIGR